MKNTTTGSWALLFLSFFFLLSLWLEIPEAVSSEATDFRLHDLGGRVVHLEAYKGRWVLLNFWATWCKPCLREIPSLENFRKKAPPNLVVLGISESLDGKEKLLRFVRKQGMTYPVLVDGLGRVADAYRVHGLPDSVLIDPAGRISWTIEGAVDWMDRKFQKKYLSGPLKGQF